MTTPDSAKRPGLRIDAIGRYLPPLRGNDFWPQEVVDGWRSAMAMALPPDLPSDPRLREAFEAGLAFRADPFQGGVTRPIMPADMTTADMELLAAEDAFSQTSVARADIGLVIQHSTGNAHIQPVNAFPVHARLGLRKDCFTFGVDAENDSFLVQLRLATALLAEGRAGSHALLLQSSQRSHLVDMKMPWSPFVGDGATAVIVSRGDAGIRVLGECHVTHADLDLPYTVGCGDAPWWTGPSALQPIEGKRLREHFGHALQWMIEALDSAMEQAGLTAADMDVVAGHLPDGWSALVYARAFAGAGFVPNTFPRLASLASCNLPLALAEARARRGGAAIGKTGLMAGGIGNIVSGLVIDWGTA